MMHAIRIKMTLTANWRRFCAKLKVPAAASPVRLIVLNCHDGFAYITLME